MQKLRVKVKSPEKEKKKRKKAKKKRNSFILITNDLQLKSLFRCGGKKTVQEKKKPQSQHQQDNAHAMTKKRVDLKAFDPNAEQISNWRLFIFHLVC